MDKQKSSSVLQDFVSFGVAALLPLTLVHNHAEQGNGYVSLTIYCPWATGCPLCRTIALLINPLPHSDVFEGGDATRLIHVQDADPETFEFDENLVIDVAVFGPKLVLVALIGSVLAKNGPFAEFAARGIV